MTENTHAPAPALGPDEIERFHQHGFLGPYPLCSPDEMGEVRRGLESEVLSTPGPAPEIGSGEAASESRHLDSPLIHGLAAHPAVVGRVASLYGPDLLVWRSKIFLKPPGKGGGIPWHQDFPFWPIEPFLTVTAWIALTEADSENGCVQVLPGSHRQVIPVVPVDPDGDYRPDFLMMADPRAFNPEGAIPMELKPGELFLFNERLLHRSEANRSPRLRMGLSVRFTVPFVRIDSDKVFPGHACVLVGGQDRFGWNRLQAPPRE